MVDEIIHAIELLNLSPIWTTLLTIIVGLSYKFRDNIFYFINNRIITLKGNLLCHDLFSTLHIARDVHLMAITFERDLAKTRIFKDFMTCKFDAIEKGSRTIIEGELYSKNSQEFSMGVKDALTEIVKDYNKTAQQTFIGKGLSLNQSQHVIAMFNVWHDDTLKSVFSRVESILENSFYNTNFQKTVAIFEVFAMATELTLSDGVNSFTTLNGYFKEVNYD